MNRRVLLLLAAATLLTAGGLSFFADPSPDALEHALETTRQHAAAEAADDGGPAARGLLPDYATPGVEHPFTSGALAGVIGVLATFGLILLLAALLRRRPSSGGGGDG